MRGFPAVTESQCNDRQAQAPGGRPRGSIGDDCAPQEMAGRALKQTGSRSIEAALDYISKMGYLDARNEQIVRVVRQTSPGECGCRPAAGRGAYGTHRSWSSVAWSRCHVPALGEPSLPLSIGPLGPATEITCGLVLIHGVLNNSLDVEMGRLAEWEQKRLDFLSSLCQGSLNREAAFGGSETPSHTA